MTGIEQAKLDAYVDESHEDDILRGVRDWKRAATALEEVRRSLARAEQQAIELGGETGPAAADAFRRSAVTMGHKSAQLADGSGALNAAAGAIRYGRQQRTSLGGEPGPRPGSPDPLQPGATHEEIAEHGKQQSKVDAWDADQERRERIARETTTEMDARFRQSTETMKKIHGEPDPVPKPSGPTGSTPGGSTPGGSTPSGPGGRTHQGPGDTSHPTYDPSGPGTGSTPSDDGTHTPGTTGPGGNPGGWTTPNGSAQSNGPGVPTLGGTPGGSVPGGSSTTTSVSSMGAGAGITGGAGLLGGAAMGGLGGGLGGLRGAVTPVSTSSAAVRPIGSTARGATSGTLGRSTTVTGAGSGSGSGGRGTGRAAGSTVRSRGAAGGRAAAAGGSGSGGRGKGSKKSERDHLEEEWELDDEDVAPAVLD